MSQFDGLHSNNSLPAGLPEGLPKELIVLRDKAFKNTLEKLSKAFGSDFLISSVISIIDDSQRALNTYSSRMLEMVVVMLPEVSFKKPNPETIAKGLTSSETVEELRQALNSDLKVSDNPKVLTIAQRLGNIVIVLSNFLKQQQALLDDLLLNHAPCLKAVAGSTIAARLLKQANGLRNLALMPASKIQVLGAEKALFKHLTKHYKPPKYGFIAQHRLITGLDKKIRGKAARIIAEHIAIAARADYFKTTSKPNELSKKLLEHIQRLDSKNRNKE